MRIAGELTERDNSKKIKLKYIDEANNKIERDKILDVISSEPKQFQLVLYSIIKLSEQKNKASRGQLQLTKSAVLQSALQSALQSKEPIFTGDVYNFYQELCLKNKIEVLTQRRVSDIIQEFDMLGIINVRIISKGRGGRMREIKLAIPKPIVEKAREIILGTLNYS